MESKSKDSVYYQRRELTLAERVAIIKEHSSSVRTGILAKKYNCSKQQVRRILHRKDEYIALWSRSTQEEVQVVRRLRTPLLIVTGRVLYEWVIRARYYMDVTDEVLREAGRNIASHIDYKDFKANNRWLNRFKNKYKLQNMRLKNMHKGAQDRRHLKSLDIGQIITAIRKDDPASLLDLDPVEQAGDESIEVRDLPDLLDPLMVDEDDDVEASGYSPYDQGIGMDGMPVDDDDCLEVALDCAKEISTYKEAVNLLGPMEQFALLKENIRAVGLINQLENLFRDEISKGNE